MKEDTTEKTNKCSVIGKQSAQSFMENSSCVESTTNKISDSGYGNSSTSNSRSVSTSQSNSHSLKSYSNSGESKSSTSSEYGRHKNQKDNKEQQNKTSKENVSSKHKTTQAQNDKKEKVKEKIEKTSTDSSSKRINKKEEADLIDSVEIADAKFNEGEEKKKTVQENLIKESPESSKLQTEESLIKINNDFEEKPNFPIKDDASQLNNNLLKLNGFCCIVSMNDGTIQYATANLTSVLGFRQEIWVGRSFVDFVHPDHKQSFIKTITAAALSVKNNQTKDLDFKNLMYASLRQYRGLKSHGFELKDSLSYIPFQLTFKIRQISNGNTKEEYVMIFAAPLQSIYTMPNEVLKTNQFCIRHSSSGEITEIDNELITYIGFFSQDMIGKSILKYFHPDDMACVKDMYKKITTDHINKTSIVQNKPIRFLTLNGDYVKFESEWKWFINPWAKKVEYYFVYIRIIEGPTNPDVFDTTAKKLSSSKHLEEIKKAQKDVKDIVDLLKKDLPTVQEKCLASQCLNIITCVKTFISEMSQPFPEDKSMEVSGKTEKDSVMLGEISPHDDYFDSNTSTETPPSYNQLNYNDNLKRFFESKPSTTPPYSDESGADGKNLSDSQRAYLSPINDGMASGSGASGFSSSTSNPVMTEFANSSTGTLDSYKGPKITESLIMKHNEDMEKVMTKKHKELKVNKDDKNNQNQNVTRQISREVIENFNALKRCGSNSWANANDYHTLAKHPHMEDVRKKNEMLNHLGVNNRLTSMANSFQQTTIQATVNATSYGNNPQQVVWPPFPYPMSAMNPAMAQSTPSTSFSWPLPVYFVQAPNVSGFIPPHNSSSYQVNYMPFAPVYPFPMFSYPIQQNQLSTSTQPNINIPMTPTHSIKNYTSNQQTTQTSQSNSPWDLNENIERPPSQTTSVKVGLGSACAMSEGSVNSFYNENIDSKQQNSIDNFLKPSSVEKVNSRKPEENSKKYTNSGSSSSSFYSSLCKSDLFGGGSLDSKAKSEETKSELNKSDEWLRLQELKSTRPKRKNSPPWMETINATPELMYLYQIKSKNPGDVLANDLLKLNQTQQPHLVNDQLNQLYLDLELESLSARLSLEESITSSDATSSDEASKKITKPKKKNQYSKLVMIYEENAPFPPPQDAET